MTRTDMHLDAMLRVRDVMTVTDGVVILTGPPGAGRDLVAVAIRLAWGVDGVVDIIDRRDASHGTSAAT